MFVSAIFLQRHIIRRHPEQIKQDSEAEKLRLEVNELQERLKKAEELLQRTRNQDDTKREETIIKDTLEKPLKLDKAQNTDADHVKDGVTQVSWFHYIGISNRAEPSQKICILQTSEVFI